MTRSTIAAKTRCDELRAQRKQEVKEIGGLMAKGQKEEAEKIKAEVKAMADEDDQARGGRKRPSLRKSRTV